MLDFRKKVVRLMGVVCRAVLRWRCRHSCGFAPIRLRFCRRNATLGGWNCRLVGHFNAAVRQVLRYQAVCGFEQRGESLFVHLGYVVGDVEVDGFPHRQLNAVFGSNVRKVLKLVGEVRAKKSKQLLVLVC
ncbi:hypothetical protein HYQ46_000189 [Verticillium longisporum]|nr:hypothetical protein HYQ46_000189 [Verticillium longisporum]